jgi:hypothetical protein
LKVDENRMPKRISVSQGNEITEENTWALASDFQFYDHFYRRQDSLGE